MPGIQLKIETNDAAVRDALRRVAGKLTGLRPAFDAIGNSLVTSTRKRFEAQRDPEGDPWQALTERYVQRSKKKGGRGGSRSPILFISGRHLESRITYKADNSAVAIGSNATWPGGDKSTLAIHQLGGTPGMAPGPAAIPARPFLGINRDDETEIGRILMKHLEGI